MADELKDWLTRRAQEKRPLYAKYGKALEGTHKGEYLAIGPEGQTIVGKRAGEVLQEAVATFGSRNFALLRIGHGTFGTWLHLGG